MRFSLPIALMAAMLAASAARAAPTVTLQKSAGSNTPQVGETYRYNLVVDVPSGTLGTGAVISDPLPSGLQFVQASSGGSYSAGTVSWALSSPLTCASVEVTLTPFADDSGLWGRYTDVQASDTDWAISTLAFNGSNCDMASHSSWFFLSSLTGYSVDSVTSVKLYYQWHEDDSYPVTTYFQDSGDMTTGNFGPVTLTAGVGQSSDVIESWDITSLGAPWTFDKLQHLDVMIEHACGGNTGTSPHHAYMNRVWAVVDFQSCGTSVWFDATPTNSLANNTVLNNTATVSGGGLAGPVSSNTVPVTVQEPTLSLTKTAQPLYVGDGETVAYTLSYSAYANGLNVTDSFTNSYTNNGMPGWTSKGNYSPGWYTSNGALSFAMGTTSGLPNTGYDLATRSDTATFSDGIVSADFRIDPSAADTGSGTNTDSASIAYLIQSGGSKFYKSKIYPCGSTSGYCVDVQDSNWNQVCGFAQIPAASWNAYPAWNNIKVVIKNYTFTIFINGAQTFYCDDPTHFITTPGQAGFYSDGGLAYWDNFHIGTDIQASAVTVWDTIPACMSYVAGSASPAAAVAGQLISWSLGSLLPGASGTVSFKAKAATCAVGAVANSASAGGSNTQAVASSASVQVIQPLVKSASAATAATGASLTYSIAYTASGGGTPFSDAFPGSSISSNWVCEGATWQCTSWSQAAGALKFAANGDVPFVAFPTSGSDGMAQETVTNAGNGMSVGFTFGYQAGKYYDVRYIFGYNAGGDGFELHYFNGTADTTLQAVTGFTFPRTASELLAVTRIGSTFVVNLNGAQLGTLADGAGSLPGDGIQGIWVGTTTTTFSGFSWSPGYKSGVVINDTLPAGMTLVTATAGVLLAGPPQVAQWVMPPAGLAAGSVWTAQLVVQPSGSACGWVTNTAQALVGSASFTSNLLGVSVTCGTTPTFTLTPSRTPTSTTTATGTPSATASGTGTPTASPSSTASATGTATRTPSPSPTATASASPSGTATGTATPSSTLLPTGSPTDTPTASPSSTASRTPTATASASPSSTATGTATPTSTLLPTGSATDTPTLSPSFTSSGTPSASATQSATPTQSLTPSASASSSATATATATPSQTLTPSASASSSASATATATPSQTLTPSASASSTATATASQSSTASPTPSGSATPTQTPTLSATRTASPTASATRTATASPTASLTFTASPTISVTATKSPVVYTYVPPLIMAPGPGVYPDPFSDRATIWFKLSADAQVRLAVYNVAGEKVRTMQQPCKRGPNKFTWAGDNNYGARCASGYYIIRLLADSSQGGQHDGRWLSAVITR